MCDLCTKERPAVNTRPVDVCAMHDARLDERMAQVLYECTECGKTYRDPVKLRNHFERTHGDLDENTCPYCGKADLKGASGVARHIGQKHKGEEAA